MPPNTLKSVKMVFYNTFSWELCYIYSYYYLIMHVYSLTLNEKIIPLLQIGIFISTCIVFTITDYFKNYHLIFGIN